MGLFGKKKATTHHAGPSQEHTAEFDNLVRQLLARDDIQGRTDVCEHIFAFAKQLLQNPTRETIMRAYDLMGNLAAQFGYVPAMLWLGDFMENVQHNDKSACIWYQRAADQGSGEGARNYADMLMAGKGVERNQREALKYYTIAMEKNIPEAAFVVGEFLRTTGDAEGAAMAYQKALNLGYAPSRMRLEHMKKI